MAEEKRSSFLTSLKSVAMKARLLAPEELEDEERGEVAGVVSVITSKTAASTPAVDSKTLETLVSRVREHAPLAVEFFDACESLAEDISDEAKRMRAALKVLGKKKGGKEEVKRAVTSALKALDGANTEFTAALKEERRTKLVAKEEHLATVMRSLDAAKAEVARLESEAQQAQSALDTERRRLDNVESGWNGALEMLRARFNGGLEKIAAL